MSVQSNQEILQLSYKQLQCECKKAGLAAIGNTEALRKRLQDWFDGTKDTSGKQGAKRERDTDDDDEVIVVEPPAKKHPKKSPSDDLICPITLELPWEPVTAEDGRVYEKEAIEQHIEQTPELASVLELDHILKVAFA